MGRVSHRRIATALSLATASVLGLGLASCSSSSNSPSNATSSTTTPLASATVDTSASAQYGTILVTSSGRTLYMLTGDSPTASICTGSCLSTWPPFTTAGAPRAGSGVEASLFGTMTRSDGSTQVTYNGHPLYTFSQDTARGQVNGEGINSFGGIWYVLDASGQPVKTASRAVTTTTSSGGNY